MTMRNNGMEQRGQEPSSVGSFVGGALLGGLIGAAIGLLFAPRAGTETREKLGENMQDIQARANKAIDELKVKSEEVIGQTKQAVEGKLSVLGDAIEAGRKAAGDVRKEWQERQEG